MASSASVLPSRLHGRLAVATDAARVTVGGAVVLDDTSLTVPRGAFYLLTGANGAGKTTLLRVLLGLHPLSSGSALVEGRSAAREGPAVRAAAGYVPPETDYPYPSLTVRQAIEAHRRFFPGWDDAYAAELVAALALRYEQPVGSLSSGEARRLRMVLALAHAPPVLLLDEPLNGLDPVAREQVRLALVSHVEAHATTAVVVTHTPAELEGLADHVGVMCRGSLVAQLSAADANARLATYDGDLPPGWVPPERLSAHCVAFRCTERAISAVLWGEEAEMRALLADLRIAVRSRRPVPLSDVPRLVLTADAARGTRPPTPLS